MVLNGRFKIQKSIFQSKTLKKEIKKLHLKRIISTTKNKKEIEKKLLNME